MRLRRWDEGGTPVSEAGRGVLDTNPHLAMKLPDMGHPELAEGMV